MKKHVLKAINGFGEDTVRNATTPESNNLFKLRESLSLSKNKSDVFFILW